MKLFAQILVFFLLFSNQPSGYCEKTLSFTDKLTIRNKKYPSGNYTKIVQFGPHRTGTTLVYNVLRYLFEDDSCMKINGFCNFKNKVIKTHVTHYFQNWKDEIYFVTIRNPIDTIYSHYFHHHYTDAKNSIPEYTAAIMKEYKEIDILQKLGKQVVLLKYEEFSKDIDVIFSSIEKAFSITIDENDKNHLRTTLSKESVLAYSNQIAKFNNWDRVTHIHGSHINDGKKENLAVKESIKKSLFPYTDLLKKWDYILENNNSQKNKGVQ